MADTYFRASDACIFTPSVKAAQENIKNLTAENSAMEKRVKSLEDRLTLLEDAKVSEAMKKLTDPLSLDNLSKYKPRPGAAESSIDPEIGADASEQQEEQEAEEDEGAIEMLRYTDVEKDIARNVLEAFLDSGE